MDTIVQVLTIYFVLINLITFIAYGMDKSKAKRNAWRIPEATLIGLAYLGGPIGALLGMKVWHHKTKKMKFKVLVPFALILYFLVLSWFILKFKQFG